MLLPTSVFLWISVGFLSLPEKSEACSGNDFPALCEFVFRNVCFEFVGGSETWYQARSSCKKRGGELLKVMDSPVKIYLKNITRARNTSNLTWWLGTWVKEEHQEELTKSELNTHTTFLLLVYLFSFLFFYFYIFIVFLVCGP